jgi:hypothetical protein
LPTIFFCRRGSLEMPEGRHRVFTMFWRIDGMASKINLLKKGVENLSMKLAHVQLVSG